MCSGSGCWIQYHGLLHREREVAWLIDQLFPPAAPIEFVDCNPVIMRVVGGHLQDVLTPTCTPGGTSWKAKNPTQVGSGKLLIRYELDAEKASDRGKHFGIRSMKFFGSLRCVGWNDSFCGDQCPLSEWTQERLEMHSNLAGNAFSVFLWYPWILAMISTYRKFAADPCSASLEHAAEDSPLLSPTSTCDDSASE